ncbi:MAG: hypothetical protein K6G00_09290 [Treponema sp.]|nr:hypothetical protein [Treponema sp.]
MSITPSISSLKNINHTALGGTEPINKVLMPVACLVINRASNQYRSRVFKNILSCGFEQVISIESYSKAKNTEKLSQEFPMVKFICSLENCTKGDLLNLGMSEVKTPYVLIIHEDLCIDGFKFSTVLAKKLIEFDCFCVCPRLLTPEQQVLPVRFTPSIKKNSFEVDSSLGVVDKVATLYPFDLTGFYDTKKFLQLGGFDSSIDSQYWQKLDFFVRSWLWGERTFLSSAFTLTYSSENFVEDRTADYSSQQFYLKNLLPVFKNDHCEIKRLSFFSFKNHSACGFSESGRLFNKIRSWVKDNMYRFKMDAVSLTEHWNEVGELK